MLLVIVVGQRVRIASHDKYHGKYGILVRRERVLPGVRWPVVELEGHYVSYVYVGEDELILPDDELPKKRERCNRK